MWLRTKISGANVIWPVCRIHPAYRQIRKQRNSHEMCRVKKQKQLVCCSLVFSLSLFVHLIQSSIYMLFWLHGCFQAGLLYTYIYIYTVVILLRNSSNSRFAHLSRDFQKSGLLFVYPLGFQGGMSYYKNWTLYAWKSVRKITIICPLGIRNLQKILKVSPLVCVC